MFKHLLSLNAAVLRTKNNLKAMKKMETKKIEKHNFIQR